MVGCGVGDDDMKPDPTGGNPNMEVCAAHFSISGSFTAGTPGRPIDPDTMMPITGCWPVGVWTFTAQISDMGNCTDAPAISPSYSFRVDRMDPDGAGYIESYALLAGGDGLQSHLHVSAGGGGDCEGGVEFGSQDGLQYWNLHPDLTGTALNGSGDFILYKTNGWPWKM